MCECVREFVCAYGCMLVYSSGLAIGMYMYMCVHKEAETYLRGNHWFFFMSIKCIKMVQLLKNVLSHL